MLDDLNIKVWQTCKKKKNQEGGQHFFTPLYMTGWEDKVELLNANEQHFKDSDAGQRLESSGTFWGDRLHKTFTCMPTKAKQGWSGQFLDERKTGKIHLLLEDVLVRPAEGAHPVLWAAPNKLYCKKAPGCG